MGGDGVSTPSAPQKPRSFWGEAPPRPTGGVYPLHVATRDPRSVPDLDLPSPESRVAKASAHPSRERTAAPTDDPLGESFERSLPMSLPSVSHAPSIREGLSFDSGGDDFDMEIERVGAMSSLVPASQPVSHSRRPEPRVSAAPAGRAGVDVAYRRLEPKPAFDVGPSRSEKLVAWLVPIALGGATLALLARFVHRQGGREIVGLAPSAFDGTSAMGSGAVAIGALVVAIAIGFVGLRWTPRSYAMLGSGASMLVASLAMVTVTLVAMDENPSPADGALLIPYVVPFALFLLGAGVVGRSRVLFLAGGAARRAAAVVAALVGGAVVFTAIEASALASLFF